VPVAPPLMPMLAEPNNREEIKWVTTVPPLVTLQVDGQPKFNSMADDCDAVRAAAQELEASLGQSEGASPEPTDPFWKGQAAASGLVAMTFRAPDDMTWGLNHRDADHRKTFAHGYVSSSEARFAEGMQKSQAGPTARARSSARAPLLSFRREAAKEAWSEDGPQKPRRIADVLRTMKTAMKPRTRKVAPHTTLVSPWSSEGSYLEPRSE